MARTQHLCLLAKAFFVSPLCPALHLERGKIRAFLLLSERAVPFLQVFVYGTHDALLLQFLSTQQYASCVLRWPPF